MTIEEKVEILRDALRKTIPRGKFIISNVGKDEVILKPSSLNHGFNKSKYFYNDDNRLVHFTKLVSCKNIIKNKKIRLYNLNKMNDPIEFLFAARKLNITNSKIKDAKSNIYCLSTCAETIIQKSNKVNQFNFWRLYGDNGFGIALYLEIKNDKIHWDNFYLSKVYYGDVGTDQSKDFRYIMKVIKALNSAPPYLDFDYRKFLCFHKSSIYSVEEEVRLIYDVESIDKNNRAIIYEDPNKDVRYIELDLLNKNHSSIKSEPLIKISKILLGYQHDDKEYAILKRQLSELSLDILGYAPDIKRSNLFSNFWGKTFIAP